MRNVRLLEEETIKRLKWSEGVSDVVHCSSVLDRAALDWRSFAGFSSPSQTEFRDSPLAAGRTCDSTQDSFALYIIFLAQFQAACDDVRRAIAAAFFTSFSLSASLSPPSPVIFLLWSLPYLCSLSLTVSSLCQAPLHFHALQSLKKRIIPLLQHCTSVYSLCAAISMQALNITPYVIVEHPFSFAPIQQQEYL